VPGAFMAVRPEAGRRESRDAVSILQEGALRNLMEVRYQPRGLYKVPRQGAFDSVHLAPKMKAPDEVLYAIDPDALRRSFARISMAPFCAHDCLHTHWRWGDWQTSKQTLGWEGWTPYCKPGAPMVPPNQEVTIRLEGAQLEYTARATKVPAGIWQIVFHHGSAYAIAASKIIKGLGETALMQPLAPGSSFQWYGFYWRMRHVFLRDGLFYERIIPGHQSTGSRDRAQRALDSARDL